jgi:hypothetical protein
MLSEGNQTDASLSKKWGSEVIHFGWTAIPNALLRNMGALDITPTEMVVICYLIMFWWEKDRLPFPSITKMATELGTSSKTIERKLGSLEKKLLIVKTERQGKSNQYDLTPMISRLADILKE